MNDLLADLFTDRTLTQPWADDEHLVLDGHWRLVYSADKKNGITLVRLYGRRALTLQQLREAGHEIAMPKRIRWKDPMCAGPPQTGTRAGNSDRVVFVGAGVLGLLSEVLP